MDQLEIDARARRRFGSAVFVYSVLAVTAIAGCSRTSHPEDRIRLTDVPAAKAAQTPSMGLQACPGLMASQLSDLHKVTLRWNASTSSGGPNDKSVGYCLYRSDSVIQANRLEECTGCQRITPTPIIGTSCVDNFGDGRKTYYYAAIAIDSRGQRSVFSNKIAASLPGKQPSTPATNVQPPPACRVSDDTKQAPQAVSQPKH